MSNKENKIETNIVSFKGSYSDVYGASSMPIYQTATFELSDDNKYDYTRSGNPTRNLLEEKIAFLEGGLRGFAFSSGMAALSVITRLVKEGENILCSDDSYGGTYRLLERIVKKQGIGIKYIDMEGEKGVENVLKNINKKTKLVMLETPTNPFQRISDIKKICNVSHEKGALVSIDNTLMSPILQKPLELGCDIVCHSATKFISGHSDCMAGVVVVNDTKLAEEIYFYQNAEGTCLSPFDSWLLLRGLKTMFLRVNKQQENALKIAEFLENHRLISKVFYCGLKSHKNYEIHKAQSYGSSSVISFCTNNLELSSHIVNNTKLFKTTVSFGSVDSRIELPSKMSHASIPKEIRKKRDFPDCTIRISVGIENVSDLINDLKTTLDQFVSIQNHSKA